MGMGYPPAGSLVTQIEIQRERRFAGYNARSFPLVYPGQEVLADQPVIRLELPTGRRSGLSRTRPSSFPPACAGRS